MCKMKSAILLKDKVFMPASYNSHTQMLEELKIKDNGSNPNFVRIEISPETGDVFTDVSTWIYSVDQDLLPKWYVAEYDEQRVRKTLTEWADTMCGKYTNKAELGTLKKQDTFKIGNIEYLILKDTPDGKFCITMDFINRCKMFDYASSNLGKSEIAKYLNGPYYEYLASFVGGDNIVQLETDLTDDCGKNKYGSYSGKVSLLTRKEYMQYRDIIPNAEGWWWLATPYDVSNYARGVCVVCSGGLLGYYYCCWDYCGVRPVCTFKSSIVVSCCK